MNRSKIIALSSAILGMFLAAASVAFPDPTSFAYMPPEVALFVAAMIAAAYSVDRGLAKLAEGMDPKSLLTSTETWGQIAVGLASVIGAAAGVVPVAEAAALSAVAAFCLRASKLLQAMPAGMLSWAPAPDKRIRHEVSIRHDFRVKPDRVLPMVKNPFCNCMPSGGGPTGGHDRACPMYLHVTSPEAVPGCSTQLLRAPACNCQPPGGGPTGGHASTCQVFATFQTTTFGGRRGVTGATGCATIPPDPVGANGPSSPGELDAARRYYNPLAIPPAPKRDPGKGSVVSSILLALGLFALLIGILASLLLPTAP